MTIDHRLALCVAFGLAVSGAWADDELPQPKAGLWEIVIQNGAASAPASTSQRCVGASASAAQARQPHAAARPAKPARKGASAVASTQPAASAASATASARPACERQSMRRLPDGVEIQMACTGGAGKRVATTRITGDLQSRYLTETTVRYDQPRNGVAESSMRIASRYLGACPSDMKPGETRMPGVAAGKGGRGGVTTDVGKIRAMNPKERERWAEQLEEQVSRQAAASAAAASAVKK
jgi:hypothetical protein